MPWFMTPFGPQSVTDPGNIAEYVRRDYLQLTDAQAAAYFAGTFTPPNVSFTTEKEVADGLKNPASVIGAAGRAAFGPVGDRVGFVGNSITQGSGASVGDAYTGPGFVHGESPATFAMLASDGRWELLQNAGIGGQTTAQIMARLQTDIIGAGCTICVLGEVFRNDFAQNVPWATTQANIVSMVAALRAAGIRPVLVTPTPDDPTAGTATLKAKIAVALRWVHGYATSERLALVDWHSPLVDPATGNVATPYRSALADVHPNATANQLLGQATAAVLDTITRPAAFPFLDNAAEGATELLSGAGLFLGTPTAGIAAGWSNNLAANAAASITTDAGIKGNVQRITTTGATGDSFMRSGFLSTGFAVGDTLELSGLVSVSSGSGARVQLSAGGTSVFVRTANVKIPVTRGRFRHRFVVPAGTTSVSVLLYALAGTGTTDYGQVSLRNLTALGLT